MQDSGDLTLRAIFESNSVPVKIYISKSAKTCASDYSKLKNYMALKYHIAALSAYIGIQVIMLHH